jgi:NTE family protein
MRQPIGLALGGGGARGAAHIGVLKALDEAGVPVRWVAGTSAGGLVGGLYAAGLSGADIEALWQELDAGALFEPDHSRLGVLSMQRLLGIVADVTGDPDLAQMPRRFAGVATDMATGERVALCDGGLCEAIHATTALPGLFPPLLRRGQYLADGGLVDNVPVESARDLGARVVIAVDVATPLDLEIGAGALGMPSSRASTFALRLLRLTGREMAWAMAYKAIQIVTAEIQRARLALVPPDLLIRPSLGTTGLFEMEAVPAGIAAGEAATRELLPQILALAPEQ